MHAAVQSIWAVGRATKRRHINLGEVKAALEAEKEMGSRHSDSFYVHLQDSQVAEASLVKGRSSSRAINKLLRQSIPFQASSNCKPFCGYVRSHLNPADDPTRAVPIRRPQWVQAEWLTRAKVGDFAALDSELLSWGVQPSQINELPDENEPSRAEKLDMRSGGEVRLQRRGEGKDRWLQKGKVCEVPSARSVLLCLAFSLSFLLRS